MNRIDLERRFGVFLGFVGSGMVGVAGFCGMVPEGQWIAWETSKMVGVGRGIEWVILLGGLVLWTYGPGLLYQANIEARHTGLGMRDL